MQPVQDPARNMAPPQSFVFLYSVLMANSIVVDVLLYFRILSYMRKHSVRVMVGPEHEDEGDGDNRSAADAVAPHRKTPSTHNVVAAPVSLLAWALSLFAGLPASILLLVGDDNMLVLLDYQLVLLFVLGTAVPVIYVGASAKLRQDVLAMRRRICCSDDHSGNSGSNSRAVYTVTGQETT